MTEKRRLPRLTMQTGGCLLIVMAGALFIFGTYWLGPTI